MNIVLAVVICMVFAGVLIFIGLNNKANMPLNDSDNNMAGTAIPQARTAKVGDTVSMNYTGRLQDGTVFDSNLEPRFGHTEPFVFTLGAGQVIAGWDKGIVGMKVGEKKTLTIAPGDAYGAGGVPGVIPPNSTLIFDVELLAINK